MRKLQTFWQNLHLRAKFLLILLVGIVIIGVDAIATLLIPLRAYDEQLYESSSQMISLYAEQIKHEMKNYEDISYRILTDSSLQENLAIIKDASPGTLAWIEAQRNVASRAAYYSQHGQFSAAHVAGHHIQPLFPGVQRRERADRGAHDRSCLAAGPVHLADRGERRRLPSVPGA